MKKKPDKTWPKDDERSTLPMTLFFVDTGEEIVFVATEDKANELANECLSKLRECAQREGEWRDEVGSVGWGPLQSLVKAVAVDYGGDSTDYQLHPDWEAIAAETAKATRERHEEAILAEVSKARARVAELEAFLIAVAGNCRHLAKSRQGCELRRMACEIDTMVNAESHRKL